MRRGLLDTALQRANGRPSAYYEGADLSRLSGDFLPSILSADRALAGDLKTLRARSRLLCADNAHCVGFLQTLKDNVVGWKDEGIAIQAQMRNPAGELWHAFNQRTERAYRDWAEPGTASVDGVDGLGDLERMAIALVAQDGEALFRIHRGFPNGWGFALEPLDIDLLDESFNRRSEPGKNEIRMGVEVNERHRPVAYHLWPFHPTDLHQRKAERVRVDAKDILHLFVRFRPGQTRGLPWFTPVIMTIRQIDRYMEAEVMRARASAATGGFFTSSTEAGAAYLDQLNKPTADQDATENGRLTMAIEPGLLRQLPPGLDFKPFDPTAPNSKFAEFQSAILRTVARGLGTSFPTFTGDLREVNYGSLRGGSILERDTWRAHQRFIGRAFVRPVYREWLAMAALHGKLALPSEDVAAWGQFKCQFRGWQWVDPLNDMQAKERGIDRGLDSHLRICDELGIDFEEIIDELAYAQSYAASKGVSIAGSDAEPVVATPDSETPDQSDEEKRRSQIETYGVAVRAGVITPQPDDEDAFRAELGLPAMSAEARAAWSKDKGTRRPITITPPPGQAPAAPGGFGQKPKPEDDDEGTEARLRLLSAGGGR